ncbi:MAG TPA: class I SAM-dependent methyltransferase [Alphaproteobacteria bacterium]|nr:class I SAM-dependent methyltransferase [Alphaproteobacteria bacterium]
MNAAVETVLADYHERAEAEHKEMEARPREEIRRRIDEFLIYIGPTVGRFLHALVAEAEAKTIVEIGTSYGYSTVWLADAARETGGKVVSLDVHAGKQDYARKSLAKAGLADYAEFRLGDARQTLAALDGPFDFVLVDLWKDLYVPCFELCYPKLAPGAFVAADNMIYPEYSRDDALAYRRHVRAKPGIESVLLPLGSGIELSRYQSGALS